MKYCGECTACCTGAVELSVNGDLIGRGNPCKFLSDGGCSIYEERPYDCRQYRCAYLQDKIQGLNSPNENGMVVDLEETNKQIRVSVSPNGCDETQLQLVEKYAADNFMSLTKSSTVSYDDFTIESIFDLFGAEERFEETFHTIYQKLTSYDEFQSLGKKMFKMDKPAHAVLCLQKALKSNNTVSEHQFISGFNNLGMSYEKIPSPEMAIFVMYELYNKIVAKNLPAKTRFFSCVSLAISLSFLGMYEDSRNLYKRLLDVLRDNPQDEYGILNLIEYNFSHVDLKCSKSGETYLQKVESYFNAATKAPITHRKFVNDGKNLRRYYKEKYFIDVEEWAGQVIDGSTLIVNDVGGYGDAIIDLRFHELLKKQGITPLFYSETKDSIFDLFNRNGFVVTNDLSFLHGKENLFFVHSIQLIKKLLKYNFVVDVEQLWNGPYIFPSTEYVEKWKKKINTPGLNIGIKWHGSENFELDKLRSVPLDKIIEATQFLNPNYYNLQLDRKEELQKYCNINDFSEEFDSWEDTAALIYNLDLVITSCTAIAHLAGAMGKNVIVLSGVSGFYLWFGNEGNNSYWYGENLVVFKQKKVYDWNYPIEAMKKFLFNTYCSDMVMQPQYEVPFALSYFDAQMVEIGKSLFDDIINSLETDK